MADASIQIDPDSPVPAYRQIVDQIRFHLSTGNLSEGEALPSVRNLAAQLGVHFNTVADAFRELAQEGWIELNQGRRAIVGFGGPRRPLAAAEVESLRMRLRHLLAEMRLKGISTSLIQRDIQAIFEGNS